MGRIPTAWLPFQKPTNTEPNVLVRITKNSVCEFIPRRFLVDDCALPATPLAGSVLDKPTYGVWLLLLQLAAYITFFDGGIQLAIARYVARSDEAHARSDLARLLSSAGTVLLIVSLVTVLLTALVSGNLTSFFRGIPASLAPSARQALLIIGTSLALTLPFSVLAGFFLGRQKE